MSHPKLHPSVVLYSVKDSDEADVIVNGRVVYSGSYAREYAERVSQEFWQVELTKPEPTRRAPRDMEGWL